MVTTLDELIATVSSDVAMIAAVIALYGMLRRGVRRTVDDGIADKVADEIGNQLGMDHITPRETLTRLLEESSAHEQKLSDLGNDIAGVSGRLQRLREQFEHHLDRR